MPKNHATKKLHLDHNGNVDIDYIRRREREFIVNKFAVPAWVTFSLWALSKGIAIQLTESLSTESKYITAKIRDLNKGKKRIYRLRFSDHPAKTDDFDFQIGINFASLKETFEKFEAILHECRLILKTDEYPKNSLENMHEHKLRFDSVPDGKKTKWTIICDTCQMRSDLTNKREGARQSWTNGKRISTISTTKENRK